MILAYFYDVQIILFIIVCVCGYFSSLVSPIKSAFRHTAGTQMKAHKCSFLGRIVFDPNG